MTNRPLSDRENVVPDVYDVELLRAERDRLSVLHEIATERTAQLAAVIDQAKAWRRNPFGVTGRGVTAYHELDSILASADTDAALREVRASALDVAADTVGPRLAGAGWLRELATGIREGGNHD